MIMFSKCDSTGPRYVFWRVQDCARAGVLACVHDCLRDRVHGLELEIKLRSVVRG